MHAWGLYFKNRMHNHRTWMIIPVLLQWNILPAEIYCIFECISKQRMTEGRRLKVLSVVSLIFATELAISLSLTNKSVRNQLLKLDFFNLQLRLLKFITEIFHLSQSFTQNGFFFPSIDHQRFVWIKKPWLANEAWLLFWFCKVVSTEPHQSKAPLAYFYTRLLK